MIPKNNNEREILSRLQKLESATFDGTLEENYGTTTAREQARAITDGDSTEHHIGKKSAVVLHQELTSHLQNYQETFSDEEKTQWDRTRQSLIDKLRDAT